MAVTSVFLYPLDPEVEHEYQVVVHESACEGRSFTMQMSADGVDRFVHDLVDALLPGDVLYVDEGDRLDVYVVGDVYTG